MIRRDHNDAWLLISQIDHAALAADLASAWGNDEVTPLPLTEWLIPAIRDHDAGWRAWEAEPTITAEGLPRGFTEMATEDAATIWSASIDVASGGTPSLAEALRRLRSAGGEVTPHDAAVLEVIATYRDFVSAERLCAKLLGEGELTEAQIDESLRRLEHKGVIRGTDQPVGGKAFVIELPTLGASPLGGIWVSRHFSFLAEQALESRADDENAVAIIRRFLRQQTQLQSEWLSAASDFAGDELDRVADTGLRYVQFFDRISLWLCMAEREEPWEATLSSNLTLRFTPLNSREITVEPWPFQTDAIELSVPAIAIEAAPLTSDDALRHVLTTAERQALRWVLQR